MTASVAMTTYNGMKYLDELLDSIKNQTRLPDEVIIVDDNSTDGTPEYVEQYIAKNSLNNWKIYRNSTNVGWKLNFRFALSYCKCDLVFLCDQDDIWKPDKIDKMTRIMEERKEILLLASNYETLQMDSEENVRIYGKHDSGVIKAHKFGYGALNVLRPGCTYCIREVLIKQMLNNDLESAPHDAILWGWATILGGLYIVDYPSIIYRRHKECASLSEGKLNKHKRCTQIDYNISVDTFYLNMCYEHADIRRTLEKEIYFSQRRKKVFEQENRIKIILFSLLNCKYYPTWRNMLSDIYIAIKK